MKKTEQFDVPEPEAVKAKEKQLKQDFALHVSLIRRSEGLSTSEAKFKAWCEGEKGLEERLGLGTVKGVG